MTASAMVIHQDLAEEGFDLNSQDYYNEISRRIRKEFPHKFEGSAKPTQKVASAVRTNTASGRRTVKLTPSQVAIAKKLGVPLEEYAKHVKEA
jgi:phage I-like protein